MKDKVFASWNKSSYLIRSIIIYTFFSVFAIISKLLDDKLGMFSSMVAIGFLLSMLGVVASILYALIMGIDKKNLFKEISLAVLVLLFFLFLMSLIPPTKVKEDTEAKKKSSEVMVHNVIAPPAN